MLLRNLDGKPFGSTPEREVQAVKQQLAHWLKSTLRDTEVGPSPADGLGGIGCRTGSLPANQSTELFCVPTLPADLDADDRLYRGRVAQRYGQ